VIPLRELSWSMAQLQHRHRDAGRAMSATMVEALAAAQQLDAGIAVSRREVGANLRAAAGADGVAFYALQIPVCGPGPETKIAADTFSAAVARARRRATV
jgi:hypothetical protein